MTASTQIKATIRLGSPRDGFIAWALFLGTVLSRVPFRSHILYHWDSVNFASGMRQFDVLQEHPQPPGYIVYIWLCHLVNLLFHDANATMVWISVVASSLAVVILYLLGRAMWNRRVGLAAALLLASSPLFWFYGEIALPHTLDTFLVLLALWLLYRVGQGEGRLLWPAVVVLGVAGGVRQQTLLFLLPVALYAAWRVGWRRLLLAGLVGAAICLTWFVPLAVSCGGVGAYLEKMGTFSARFQQTTSVMMGAGWTGVAYNLRKLSLYTVYGAAAAFVPLGIYGIVRLVRWHWPRDWGRLAFLGLWMIPVLLFYGLIHMGQQGLVFVFLPALLLLGAAGLDQLLRVDWAEKAVVVLLVAAQAAVFCLVSEYPLGPGTQRLLTRETVVNSDHYYTDRFAAIRENFPPRSTAILAANWDHVRYYLPEYVTLSFSSTNALAGTGADEDSVVTPGELGLQPDLRGQTTFVLFDDELASFNESAALTKKLELNHSGTLVYFSLTQDMAFHLGTRTFGVIEP